ncbi:interferon-inducible GTPase 5-like [Genypterus blacodes]|uniref:interferon-inducible GTPase 5-like n=1 Tax=Genypterus blacodes TaxID=154954 RepID=UPI003F7676C3
MDNEPALITKIREAMESSGPAAAAATIQAYLDDQRSIHLNIAVTGEAGSGKSTFVNAFRGVDNRDRERAARTGCRETTMDIQSYAHPHLDNVHLWDLPGIGTTKFPASQYLEYVQFSRFDFFIIVSSDRFRENDVKLAQAIQGMGKKFYFIRSKIDHNLEDEERSQWDFNAERTLAVIREDCIQGLLREGAQSPKVFLISNFHLLRYDFSLLQETMAQELPTHKRNVLLIAMPSISLQIINNKKEGFASEVKYLAGLFALMRSLPVSGNVAYVDIFMVKTVKQYQTAFGLDMESLRNLAGTSRVQYDDLKAATTSPLAATEITQHLIMRTVSDHTALLMGEQVSAAIPLFGLPVALTSTFLLRYSALNICLNMLADDAQAVFTRLWV